MGDPAAQALVGPWFEAIMCEAGGFEICPLKDLSLDLGFRTDGIRFWASGVNIVCLGLWVPRNLTWHSGGTVLQRDGDLLGIW